MEKYRYCKAKAAQQGFTLTELLITLAILVILMAIGAPQLQTFVVQRAVASQAETFAESIRLARSEALKRGQRVSICASSAPEAARPVCSPDGATVDWAQGWLVWVDDGATPRAFDSGESILKVQQAFNMSGGIVTNSGQASISFAQNGMAIGSANSFKIRPKLSGDAYTEARNNRCITLSLAGRVQIRAVSPSDCPPASGN